MTDSGCFLSCEERTPAEPVEQARMAERTGSRSLWMSDHCRPWNDGQGRSPFVRSVIGDGLITMMPDESLALPRLWG
ncbi:hypothetical protein [Streptomyces triticiradicis]|uniref:Uncharacterized protein n=1 Tax=Streptomyces triticiradicis TaxID=2651189 RepID=A0A7J5DI65_9ACTN|nr:hypothetical protein F8144_13725 [Streptomyces triticiradicis]